MKGTVRLAGILGALVGATAFAFAEDVDWKVFGGATLGVVSVCFFDAKSVAHTSDGRVRAWTKCLPQKDLENVDFKNDRGQKIAEKAAKKIVQGYVPPLIVIGQVDFDKITGIAGYEETANLDDIDPNSRMLLELNCSERMDRTLSIYAKFNEREQRQDKPSDWKYIAPETNVAYLHKILCPSQ